MLKEIYRKSDDIVTRKIIDETILVPIRNNTADMQQIFSLNDLGIFIWDHLDGKNRGEDIIEKIISRFEVDRERAEADFTAFIDSLLEQKLVMSTS